MVQGDSLPTNHPPQPPKKTSTGLVLTAHQVAKNILMMGRI